MEIGHIWTKTMYTCKHKTFSQHSEVPVYKNNLSIRLFRSICRIVFSLNYAITGILKTDLNCSHVGEQAINLRVQWMVTRSMCDQQTTVVSLSCATRNVRNKSHGLSTFQSVAPLDRRKVTKSMRLVEYETSGIFMFLLQENPEILLWNNINFSTRPIARLKAQCQFNLTMRQVRATHMPN